MRFLTSAILSLAVLLGGCDRPVDDPMDSEAGTCIGIYDQIVEDCAGWYEKHDQCSGEDGWCSETWDDVKACICRVGAAQGVPCEDGTPEADALVSAFGTANTCVWREGYDGECEKHEDSCERQSSGAS